MSGLFITIWLFARASVITGLFLLFLGWYYPGLIFLAAWVISSIITWFLAPIPEVGQAPATTASMELANEYWEASAQMARAAQYYGSKR